MVEIAAALSMAGSAFNMIKGAIEQGREVQDLAQTFSSFFDAKEQIAEANIAASNPSMLGKLFSGKSVEAQALQVTAAKHKMMQLEKELREFLIYTGQMQFYEDMMRERRVIRAARIKAAQAAAEKRAFWIDFGLIAVATVVSLKMIIGTISIIAGARGGEEERNMISESILIFAYLNFRLTCSRRNTNTTSNGTTA